ncbi:hypothetical protein HG530_011575 [Fusarium avenaceum]|nr:hypothetical protein HG530_011575 [Fusarium avenaceum]
MSFGFGLPLLNNPFVSEAHKSDSSSSTTSGSTGGRVQAQLPPVGHDSADVVDVGDQRYKSSRQVGSSQSQLGLGFERSGRLEKLELMSDTSTGSEVGDGSEVEVTDGAEGVESDGSGVAEGTDDSVCSKAEEKEGLGSESSGIREVVNDTEVPGIKVIDSPDGSDRMEDGVGPEVVDGSGGRVRSDVTDASDVIGDRVADGADDSEGLVKSNPEVTAGLKGPDVGRDGDSPGSKVADVSKEMEGASSEDKVSDPVIGSETKEAIDDSDFGVAVMTGGSAVSEDPETDGSWPFDLFACVSTNVGSSDRDGLGTLVIVGVAVAGWLPSIWPPSDARLVISDKSSEVRLPEVSKDGKTGAEISENENGVKALTLSKGGGVNVGLPQRAVSVAVLPCRIVPTSMIRRCSSRG